MQYSMKSILRLKFTWKFLHTISFLFSGFRLRFYYIGLHYFFTHTKSPSNVTTKSRIEYFTQTCKILVLLRHSNRPMTENLALLTGFDTIY